MDEACNVEAQEEVSNGEKRVLTPVEVVCSLEVISRVGEGLIHFEVHFNLLLLVEIGPRPS